MNVCCLDVEGVLLPEIWIAVSKKTRIGELRLTTRDIPDYDQLMKGRIRILREHKIKLIDIQAVISQMRPLSGAKAFLDRLRQKAQVILLSDTYYEFAMPLMKKLNFPTLFCNTLKVWPDGMIEDYVLRQQNGKEQSVLALKNLKFRVTAVGDSYNDISMLKAADQGIFYNPPANIVREFPEFTLAKNYAGLLKILTT